MVAFSERTRWDRRENAYSRALAELRAVGTPFLDLTQSNPTECGFLYDAARILEALTQDGALRYQPDPRGILRPREAISGYYTARGAHVTADELVLTSGTSEGYSFLFRLLCNAGDEVLIPSPSYPLFDFLADLSDVKLARFPLLYDHGWQIDFAALGTLVGPKTRAAIVVHPNNPTGHYVSPSEQTELVRFCAARGVVLIADEVFLDFSWRDAQKRSLAGSGEALTFTLGGLSKICGLPQMKLAWIAVSGPEEGKKEALARLEVIADSYLSVGTPVQVALPELLSTRAGFQAQAMGRIRRNLSELDEQLSIHTECTRLESEGGWTAVLRVPAVQSDEELAIALLNERGVAVHPGHFYDFAQAGYLVVSLIVPPAEFSEGIRRILGYFTDPH